MPDIKNDSRVLPEHGRTPSSIVLMLHGYGSNREDLISLVPYLQPFLPDTVFVSPDAPTPCEQGVGYQWFSLNDYTPQSLLTGTETAHPSLQAYVEKLVEEYGIDWEKVIFSGFSQGAMMSLYSAPRMQKQVGGILAYSGALVGGGGLKNGHKPPVCLIHGEADMVVPFAAYGHAKQLLKTYDFDVSGHSTPDLGHSIDEKGIRTGTQFMQRILD